MGNGTNGPAGEFDLCEHSLPPAAAMSASRRFRISPDLVAVPKRYFALSGEIIVLRKDYAGSHKNQA
jgi:hypothetical protein